MEAQLAAYRERKNKEFQTKPPLSSGFPFFRMNAKQDQSTASSNEETRPHSENLQSKKEPPTQQYFDEASTIGDGSSRKYKWLLFGLKFLLWTLIWGLFVEIGFGAVFFAVSACLFIYFNTRTGTRSKDSGPSAYSVFNPNCERLDGTFTAEQFEKELRYGALHAH